MARRISVSEASSVRNAAWAVTVTFFEPREGMVGRKRLGVENVEAGMAQPAAAERGDQGLFVDERPARGIDQDRARLHASKPSGVEQAARLIVEDKVQRNHVGACQQRVEINQRNLCPGSGRSIPGDHLHADPCADARDLASDPAEADNAERLAGELHAFGRLPGPGAHLAIHPRDIARAGEHQRDRVLGDGGVAIALDRVHRDAEIAQRRNVHVARRAGAEEHDMLELPAQGDRLGRQIGMVVEADRAAGEQSRQVGARKGRRIDRDRRVVGAMHARKDRGELLVAVDEKRFHAVIVSGRRARGVHAGAVSAPW